MEIHAAGAYVTALMPCLVAEGAVLRTSLEGLSPGQRLAWTAGNRPNVVSTHELPTGSCTAPTHASTSAFVDGLLDDGRAMTMTEFLVADPKDWKVPGLYSWWVDPDGAADLTGGLGETIAPGLIYAGLAGATRWPSGKRSTNTLWSRIAGMHLGGNHGFSTFRRTLAAILSHATGSDSIEEGALTAWMTTHLRVVAIGSDDPDTLGHLEGDVLATIDPPLNLRGMEATPIRLRLSELRRKHR